MSVPYTASAAEQWVQTLDGELLQGAAECVFESTSIDTRSLEPGALFVAIAGPTHDAHGFLADAVERGATGLVVETRRIDHASLPKDVVVIGCNDTTRALGAIAAGHRSGFSGPLLGITGSSGKTTTKEMAAAVFDVDGPCLKTLGNLNNDYGLPLTLLRRGAEHTSAVIELGMNHRGEIGRLAEIAKPTAALITNIGVAHIEHLGSPEEIAAEKGDLFAALGHDAVAVANFDDPAVVEQAKRAAGRVISYARSAPADVRAENVRFAPEGVFRFDLRSPVGDTEIALAGLSETTVINALAAAAAGIAVGISLESICKGLAAHEPASGRMTRHALPGGITLIDDSYNANPVSMRASLESLAALRSGRRAFAVLGDMGELGNTAEEAHRATGQLVGELGIERLFAVGSHAQRVERAAVEAGLSGECAYSAKDIDEIVVALRDTLRAGDWILVKGSRAMRMERIVEALSADSHSDALPIAPEDTSREQASKECT